MGNKMCYNDNLCQKDNKKSTYPATERDRKVREAKKDFKKIILSPVKQFSEMPNSEALEKFTIFHQQTLIQVVDEYKFPQAGKDFIQPTYNHSFISIAQMDQSIKECQNLSKMQHVLSNMLKSDIEESGHKSLFCQFIQEYNKFYDGIFSDLYEYCKSVSSSPDQRIKTKSKSLELDLSSRRTIQYALNSDANLAKCIILSMVTLFTLLKSVLIHTYKELIIQLPNSLEHYIQKELFFQKIIQYFIYKEDLKLSTVLQNAINYYYSMQNENQHIQVFDEFKKGLDESLHPEPGQTTNIRNIESNSWIMQSSNILQDDNDDNILRSSSQQSFIQMHSKIMKSIEQMEQENVPYKELFVIFHEIIKEKQPYRIYQQIERLNESIVEIYMTQRPKDQIEQYREVILTEDNRLQIILYLIHKFREHTRCDLRKVMFNKLKFMMDFDQVLDKRIKYEIDQSFVRFYACLEMIVQTNS